MFFACFLFFKRKSRLIYLNQLFGAFCEVDNISVVSNSDHVLDATAYLKDVVFEGNKFEGFDFAYSVAIYVDDSQLVAENCTFKGNGYKDSSKKFGLPTRLSR